MSWEKAGNAVKRVAARKRPDDDDDDTPPAGGGGAALQGQPHEFETDRDDRLDKGRDPHAPRSRIGRTPMAQCPRDGGPSDALAADRGRAISRRLPVTAPEIGQLARRLAAAVVEKRRKAVEAAELDETLATVATREPRMPSQARVVGREGGHPLGRSH